MTQLTGRKAMSLMQNMPMLMTGFVLVLMLSSTVDAQWATNGNNINNTNTGNVGIGTTSPGGDKLITAGNILAGDITSHTLLYSSYDSQANVIMELGYGTATANITPLASLVLSKNLTSANNPVGVISFANSSIANGNDKRLSAITSWTDGATNSGTLQFLTSGAGVLNERMRFTSGGNVGIGTANPAWGRLQVNKSIRIDDDSGSATGSDTLLASPNLYLGTSTGGNAFQFNSNGGLDLWQYNGTAWGRTVTFAKTGNVGIGTTNPGRPLVVTADAGGIPLRVYRNASTVGWGTGIQWAFNNSSGNVTDYAYVNSSIVSNTAGAENGTLGFFTVKAGTLTQQAIVDQNGNVGIGTTAPSATLHVQGTGRFTGNLTVDGSIAAKYQDVAEWVESSQSLPAGTVVVLDQTRSNQVIASSHAYDTRVAGVVSAQPGITLGEKGESKVLVATTGRVKVRVDATNGPIQVGDLLVTSDIAGVAKKSEPLMLGSVPIHRPGTLIGKALEPLAQGQQCEILVLLSLQ